jgi:hypothetical protein
MFAQARFLSGSIICVILFCQTCGNVLAQEIAPPANLSKLAATATSPDAAVANAAIARLRAAGPAGLAALMAVYRADIDAHMRNPAVTGDPQRWDRISSALDRVARQRDAWACGLYWYTDLPAAESAAKASGKPILSLHLLGQLDQELSCANSRFFRTTLYPNQAVQDALRNGFVLFWQSERPVPTITIDFGDGRKIVRTITGNSVHYILDADGRVIDALPGMYGVQPFLQRLGAAATIELSLRQTTTDEQREAMLEDWHRRQIAAIDSAAGKDLNTLHLAALPATDDLAAWQKFGMIHLAEMQVDNGVRAVMIEKNPDAFRAGRTAMTKMIVESPLVKAVRNLETTIAPDCIRDEYVLHRQIHQMLADGGGKGGLDAFNDAVYSNLFLTPRSDPWLGLAPPDAYSALDHNGLVH